MLLTRAAQFTPPREAKGHGVQGHQDRPQPSSSPIPRHRLPWSIQRGLQLLPWLLVCILLLLLAGSPCPTSLTDQLQRWTALGADVLGFAGIASRKSEADTLAVELTKAWESQYPFLVSGDEADLQKGVMGKVDPRPPHLEDCDLLERNRRIIDERDSEGRRPLWSHLGASTSISLGAARDSAKDKEVVDEGDAEEALLGSRPQRGVVGPYPPWVTGSDEDNVIFTRRVQRDLWLHQHPRDCSAPGVKFLVVNLTNDYRGTDREQNYLGVGAQAAIGAQLLAEAVKAGRVLVIHYYRRTDFDGCQGELRGRWACYFAPETSEACRKAAFKTIEQQNSNNVPNDDQATAYQWGRRRYIYWGTSPQIWGAPWELMSTSVEVHGQLINRTIDDNHGWFRSQSLRYLMRYPSPRLCHLVNRARHAAFKLEAAEATAEAMLVQGRKEVTVLQASKAVLPPLHHYWQRLRLFQGKGRLMSMHVRQGDKKGEMVIHQFSDYMALAAKVRVHFPDVAGVWLLTEMQSIVEEAKNQRGWRFYYTDVPRQDGGTHISDYEGSMGLGPSTDNAFVNLLMAVSCDFFVGTMGSTFSLIINDLRRTGGRKASGMLSVNKDRAWMTTEERVANGLRPQW